MLLLLLLPGGSNRTWDPHPLADPKRTRLSCTAEEPVVIAVDVTGSMKEWPAVICASCAGACACSVTNICGRTCLLLAAAALAHRGVVPHPPQTAGVSDHWCWLAGWLVGALTLSEDDKLPMFYGQVMMQGYLTHTQISFAGVADTAEMGDGEGGQCPLATTDFTSGAALDLMIKQIGRTGPGLFPGS